MSVVADAEPVAQARHRVVLILCRCAHFEGLLQWLAHVGANARSTSVKPGRVALTGVAATRLMATHGRI